MKKEFKDVKVGELFKDFELSLVWMKIAESQYDDEPNAELATGFKDFFPEDEEVDTL